MTMQPFDKADEGRPSSLNARERAAVAFHEAAHVVIARHQRIPVVNATVVPGEGYLGRVEHRSPLRGIDLEGFNSERFRGRMERSVRTALAGAIAERKHDSSSTTFLDGGDGGDLALSYELAGKFVGSHEEGEEYIQRLHDETKAVIDEPSVWRAVERVAAALLAGQTLNASQLNQLAVVDGGPRLITANDLAGLPGVRRDVVVELVSRQPTTVLEALRIPGVGRKTAYVLLDRGLLTDPEGIRRRPLTTDEYRAHGYKDRSP